MRSPLKRAACAVLGAMLLLAVTISPGLCPAVSAQPAITLIISEENTGDTVHIVGLDVSTHVDETATVQKRIDGIAGQGGLVVMAHPMVSTLTSVTLASLDRYAGMEIYNADVARTSALLADATVRWDLANSARMLGGKGLVWGFAVDDAHRSTGFFLAWVMAKSASADLPDVLSALRTGSFYGSTGAEITDIRVLTSGASKVVSVTLPEAGTITFLKAGGLVARKVTSSAQATYTIKGTEGYVRVEVRTAAGKAWTQPMRVCGAGKVANPYAGTGAWYKGSVHCHTTKSDGEWAPQYVVEQHAARGYDFLAITDHNVITVP